ncbi:MAG TPA: TetR family transcriptional regulator C-terminal domain-containing protein [Gammaproteobacteria bacterium]|nr:TetR family transcriptional regulator C-terminal domain-containing protein [Gammaproteobacteria bacterium]
MTRTATREELIKVGTEIIAQQGFNTTGINAILRAAGVPRGSFYYYFASKDDFGLAVIDHFAEAYASQIDSFLKDDGVAPLQRMRNYLEAGMATISYCQFTRGCPIGHLSQELASQNEKFRTRLNAVFRSWKQRYAQCLGAARDAGEIPQDSDVDQLAELLLTGWEGASLRAKVARSIEPMQAFTEVFFDKVLK